MAGVADSSKNLSKCGIWSGAIVRMHDIATVTACKVFHEIIRKLVSPHHHIIYIQNKVPWKTYKTERKKMCQHHLLLQLLVEVKIRQHVEHGDDDLRVLLQELLQRGDHGGMALVADDLRERANDLLLQPGRGHGEHLDELLDEGVGVGEEVQPPELRDDEPPHVVLQRQSVERPAAAVEVLGQLLEEQSEEARMERGDGEERAREARRVRGRREEQLAEPRGGGGREGGDAREEARGGGGVRGERAPEAGREGVRRGERRGLVRRDEERAARVRQQRRRRVDGSGGVGAGGTRGLRVGRRGRALAEIGGAAALQEHHGAADRRRGREVGFREKAAGERGISGGFWRK